MIKTILLNIFEKFRIIKVSWFLIRIHLTSERFSYVIVTINYNKTQR